MAVVAATSISKLGEMQAYGGRLEFWILTIDPDSLAAAAQIIETVAIPGARAGDPTFVNPRAIETQLVCQGSKVTADDVVSVYLYNGINATTAIDGGSKVYDLMIFKLAVAGA